MQNQRKPPFSQLRELQREFLQLRWNAICARGDQEFYARSINTHVVTFALGGDTSASDGARHNLPSYATAASPQISTFSLLFDAATCGLWSRRRVFADFGDGMVSFNEEAALLDYYPENARSYRARRLAVAVALIYVWMFVGVILFWIWRDATGSLTRLTVPPYGSGIIHLLLSLAVVLTYVLGIMISRPHVSVGMREGALPSLLPLVLQTPYSQFMSSYAWSSRYVSIVRSLSVILGGECWLDVRELTPGDRVTQEIARAAATVRVLVIFFSYEYLRSVNCTLEFLTALRYRAAPQVTVILLEALVAPQEDEQRQQGGDGSASGAGRASGSKSAALTMAEAVAVMQLFSRAVPGLLVARSIAQLLEVLDQHCIRSVNPTGITSTIEWWARHGKARVSRVTDRVHVVPPLLHDELNDRLKAFTCSCRRRRKGDVAGGFSLLSGDGRSIHWYRPPNSATLTMVAVLFVEVLVYAHMFIYCLPDVDALTIGHYWFEGSCLPTSSFLYFTSLLPLALVAVQYAIGLRGFVSQDPILLPLNVAAHTGRGLRSSGSSRSSGRGSSVVGGESFNALIDSVRIETERLEAQMRAAAAAVAVDVGADAKASPAIMDRATSWVARQARQSTAANDSFTLVFVTSDDPTPGFTALAETLSEFVSRRAIGIATRIIRASELPHSARRLAVYVFLLDSPESVDSFYHRVHCVASHASPLLLNAAGGRGAGASAAAAAHAALPDPWPTCQVVVLCHADVLKTRGRGPAPAASGSAGASPPGGAGGRVSVAASRFRRGSVMAALAATGGSVRSLFASTSGSMRSILAAMSSAGRRPPPLRAQLSRGGMAVGRDPATSVFAGSSGAEGGGEGLLASLRAAAAGARTNSAEVRQRWRQAFQAVARSVQASRTGTPLLFDLATSGTAVSAAPADAHLPITGHDGALAPHLRTALFEYLLIVTGSKAGVDPSSPYDSLAQALFDTIGRKVGAVLEARSSTDSATAQGAISTRSAAATAAAAAAAAVPTVKYFNLPSPLPPSASPSGSLMELAPLAAASAGPVSVSPRSAFPNPLLRAADDTTSAASGVTAPAPSPTESLDAKVRFNPLHVVSSAAGTVSGSSSKSWTRDAAPSI